MLLHPVEMTIELLYVYNTGEQSECVQSLDEISEYDIESNIFSPMFYVDITLGDFPKMTAYSEVGGVQSDNWMNESIKFDLVADQFINLSSVLDTYKDDFYVSMESGNKKWSNKFLPYDDGNKRSSIINIAFSLTMKDYLEYDQIK